jgi:hypothetical protein
MFTALRTGFVRTSTFQKLATTSRLRSRFGQSLLPNRDREGVIRSLRPTEGDEDAKWFNSWQAEAPGGSACPTLRDKRGAGASACQL